MGKPLPRVRKWYFPPQLSAGVRRVSSAGVLILNSCDPTMTNLMTQRGIKMPVLDKISKPFR
jgi:hypothetical protein